MHYQEWWDSLFKPSAPVDSKQQSQRVEHSPARLSAPADSRDPVKSTAAVLRLSDALQRAPRSQTGAVNTTQTSSLSGFSF